MPTKHSSLCKRINDETFSFIFLFYHAPLFHLIQTFKVNKKHFVYLRNSKDYVLFPLAYKNFIDMNPVIACTYKENGKKNYICI
jgi:hypothetical protein